MITLLEAIRQRHSVRSFQDRPLEPSIKEDLAQLVAQCNAKGNLHLQLVTDEPKAFDCFLSHYGKFSGITNYFALCGKPAPDLDERLGYWGEQLVLRAQQLGLNTCWVGLTFAKVQGAYTLEAGEKLRLVIALGYGLSEGKQHKSKRPEQVSRSLLPSGEAVPEWFQAGVDAALLAPTAVNQQKFLFTLHDDHTVSATAGIGFFSKVDLGIAKLHFEIGAAPTEMIWR